jgi:PadR family transcriptional regulator, regulatory protein PadR
MSRESLGHFELLVMLALLRQGDEAYGVPIADAIAQSTGKTVILASVYNTLERLEQKGLVRSTLGQPTPERGGRAKRYFSITTPGLREVRAAKKALTGLWRGIPVHEG